MYPSSSLPHSNSNRLIGRHSYYYCCCCCCCHWRRRRRRGSATRSMGYVDAQQGDEGRTAFRRAEKKYKLYKHASTSRSLHSKLRLQVPPTDLTDVLDFWNEKTLSCVAGVRKLNDQFEGGPVYVLETHPGFYFIPKALSVEQQFSLIKDALTSFIEPPNRTNHYAAYGPISNLWSSVQSRLVLIEDRFSVPIDSSKFQLVQLSPEQGISIESSAIKATSVALPDQDQISITDDDSSHTALLSKGQQANLGSAMPHHLPQDVKKTDVEIQGTGLQDSLPGSCAPQPRLCSTETAKGPEACWQFIDPSINTHNDSHSLRSCKIVPAELLLRKLRWATLGLQFDWSKRAYNTALPYKKFPTKLADLAARLAFPVMGEGNFHAEAAIVNFFGNDDMLGGHIDDMEADWSKPIVSISLGCKAIFLLGGVTRDEPPIAMFLRSGDVVLMAGEARSRFHGVPRIFADACEADLPDFTAHRNDELDLPFVEYIRQSRINVNIRQVF